MPPTVGHKLQCDSCSSTYFFEKFHITYRQGGGTTKEVAGYACRQCNSDVDLGRMIEKAEVERLKQELREKQDEIASRSQSPRANLRVQDKATVSLKEG